MPRKTFARIVGARLKQARETMGLSQEDVASDLNVAQQTLANWEAGRAMPDLFRLRGLCYAYGIPSDFFLQGLAVVYIDIAEALPDGVCEPLDKARKEFKSYMRTFAVPGVDSNLIGL